MPPAAARPTFAGRGRGRCTGDQGLSVVLVGLLLIPLLVITSFAVDLGADRAWRRQSQNSTDSGALAGALLSSPSGSGPAVVRSEAAKVTARNMLANQALTPTAGSTSSTSSTCAGPLAIQTPANSTTTCYTATSGSATVYLAVANPYDHTLLPTANNLSDAGLVWVRACKTQPHALAGLIGQRSLDMCTESVARNTLGADGPTIYGASTSCPSVTLKGTIHIQDQNGNQSGLVASKANCSQAIDEQGGNLYAGYLEAPNGSSNVSGPSGIHTTSATVSGLAPDPYAWLPNPVTYRNAGTLNCDPNPYTSTGCSAGSSATSGGVTTYQPGVYSGLNLNAQTAKLMPGIYFLNGAFSMDAASKVTTPYGGVLFVQVSGAFQLDMTQAGSSIVSTSNLYPGNALWPCTTAANCPKSQIAATAAAVTNADTGQATRNPWAEAPVTVYQPVTNNQNMSFGSAPGSGMTWQGGVYLVPGPGNTAKIQLPSTNGMNVVLRDARLVPRRPTRRHRPARSR
jgi:hypothetical protein